MAAILLVDDDQNVRKVLRRILENEDMQVSEATNGQEAVDLYRSNAFDVVVIDIVMPEKDGLSTITEIKKINAGAKIVAISGGLVLTAETYLDEAKSIGADEILAKPIHRELFISTIQKVMNAK